VINYKLHVFLLLKRLSLLVVLYSLCRIGFHLLNRHHFSGIGWKEIVWIQLAGLRFDISAILALNLPFIFFSILPFTFLANRGYQLFLKILFFVTNAAGLAANCIDMAYFPFTLKRLTADFIDTMRHTANLPGLGSIFTRYWYIFLIWSALIGLLLYAYRKIDLKYPALKPAFVSGSAWLLNLFSFLLLAGVTVLGIRGGWQLVPISNSTAGEYSEARNSALLLNSTFSIFNTIGYERLNERNYMAEAERIKLFSPLQSPHPDKAFQKKNVVIIILESFSKEFTFLSNKKSYTPFFDSIMKEGYIFTNGFSNGKTSAEGIPAILASMPSLLHEAYPFSVYSSSEVTSIASLLKPLGYTSSFFHGGTNGTMNFQSFTGLAGFDQYYGRTEYKNEMDFDGNWGIWDEPFLQFCASKLNQTKEPFLSAIFTLSSHDPFLVPEKYADKFPEDNRTINPCIGYTDFSLRRFFKSIEHTPWFRNTLFVFTADHTGYSDDPYWGNPIGQFSIPICFYTPDGSLKGTNTTLMQQIDILPTLLSELGYEKPFFSFGRNALDTAQAHFGVNFKQELYQFYMGDHFLQFDGTNVKGFYDMKKDSLLTNNLLEKSLPEQLKMELFLKAFLQTYNHDMITNKMTLNQHL
jgi:phosphoglycerol transferase MdoB-like AlkP superfamily enzyme